ncbi:MAG TPA: hypothetical protein VE994_04615 [Terriglobales bacterium]|nr:hypothetical protein [Terriglobales bacterium]
MIPPFSELAEHFGIGVVFAPIVLAAVVTSFALVIEAIAQWFDDRNP